MRYLVHLVVCERPGYDSDGVNSKAEPIPQL